MLLGSDRTHNLTHIDVDELLEGGWADISNKTKIGAIRIDISYEDFIQERPKGPYETSAVFFYDASDSQELVRDLKYNTYT
jgi:hypothetical protein